MHNAWPVVALPPPSIGWTDPLALTGGDGQTGGVFGTVAHANSGTDNSFPNPGVLYHAGVVNYAAGSVVVWSHTFEPLFDAGAPEPFLIPMMLGFVEVVIGTGEYAQALQPGLLTLTATIDGEASDSIVLMISSNYYALASWGPAPWVGPA